MSLILFLVGFLSLIFSFLCSVLTTIVCLLLCFLQPSYCLFLDLQLLITGRYFQTFLLATDIKTIILKYIIKK